MSDEGRLIADRYRILDRIGRGGMATVWRARDELLGRQVAVKKLHPQPHLDTDALDTLFERARREARSAARISHPNVVVVHDVVDDEGLPVIVMEYVPSTTLADLVKEHGPVPPEEAARIGRRMLAALRAAHRAGILHRDVKPANVLLAEDGRVVLTDFGIAQAAETSALTRTGQLVGSVDFMAPERLVGAKPGPEADLWALGATLFQAVDGRSPFLRDTVTETMYAIAMEPAPEVRGAGPLTPLIQGLLAPRPADRISAEDAERLLRTVGADPRRTHRAGYPPTPPAATAPPAGTIPPAATTPPAATVPPVATTAPADTPATAAKPALSPVPAPSSEPAQSPDPDPDPDPDPEPDPGPDPGPRTPEASAADLAAEPPKPATTAPQARRPSGRTGRAKKPAVLAAVAAVVATAALLTTSSLIDRTGEKNTGNTRASAGSLPAGGTTPPPSADTPTASPVSSSTSPSSSTSADTTSATTRKPSQESTPKAGQEDSGTQPGAESPSTGSGSGSSAAPTGHALVVPATEKCLSGGAGTEGTQLVQATCDDSATQRWLIGSDGTFRSAGKCMTVAGGASADRTEIQLTGCDGDAAQRFHFSGTELLADQSQKCVTIFGGTSGTVVVLWECDNWDNQTWMIR
ncbi:serine/threonine protein kinase [Streptomyces xylophagus]|uniref:serine/threonine protein kinase n=1 Tax=Streptomyces xylophagus TaxID=285514 RepID=UPI0005BE36C5|nr:serine/threonine protein kinase [Streptomyces xylophagus]